MSVEQFAKEDAGLREAYEAIVVELTDKSAMRAVASSTSAKP
jgi:hypothetical protein